MNMTSICDMQERLRTVDELAEQALRKRESLPFGSPEYDEWNGISFACMREQRHLKSDIGRARQMATDVASPQ